MGVPCYIPGCGETKRAWFCSSAEPYILSVAVSEISEICIEANCLTLVLNFQVLDAMGKDRAVQLDWFLIYVSFIHVDQILLVVAHLQRSLIPAAVFRTWSLLKPKPPSDFGLQRNSPAGCTLNLETCKTESKNWDNYRWQIWQVGLSQQKIVSENSIPLFCCCIYLARREIRSLQIIDRQRNAQVFWRNISFRNIKTSL